jgi:hypothetical protein
MLPLHIENARYLHTLNAAGERKFFPRNEMGVFGFDSGQGWRVKSATGCAFDRPVAFSDAATSTSS